MEGKSPRQVDPRNLEVVDDEMAAVLRTKSGAERLRIAFGMFTFARRLLIAHLRHQHPEWTEVQISGEAARRLSHGAV